MTVTRTSQFNLCNPYNEVNCGRRYVSTISACRHCRQTPPRADVLRQCFGLEQKAIRFFARISQNRSSVSFPSSPLFSSNHMYLVSVATGPRLFGVGLVHSCKTFWAGGGGVNPAPCFRGGMGPRGISSSLRSKSHTQMFPLSRAPSDESRDPTIFAK